MNLTEFRQSIKDWANFQAWSDQLIDSWIEMARQDLSTRMRVADMVQIDTASLVSNRVQLPVDWQENDFVRLIDGGPIEYKTRHEFYQIDEEDASGYYTVSGKYFQLGGPEVDAGTEIELHYFGDLPVLSGDSNWVTLRFLELFLSASLKFAFAFSEDLERSVILEQKVDSMVGKANDAYTMARASGSLLKKTPKRSFG